MDSDPKLTRAWANQSWISTGLIVVLLGLLALYVPTYLDLARRVWNTDEQGHGPIILALSLWLVYRRREALAALTQSGATVLGSLVLIVGLLCYLAGRSQGFQALEVGSQLPVLLGLLLLFKGAPGLRMVVFPLFFLCFLVPLPESLVATITAPLKLAVSAVASQLLYWAGYPVARTGVIMSVGPYQLLVADACAGLNSIFTLEALGLLYLNLMGYTSVKRNVALALLVVPIAFFANIVRVLILVLVTFYLGDEAGQGFVHGFAGMVLFMVGLMVMLAADGVLGRVFPNERVRAAA